MIQLLGKWHPSIAFHDTNDTDNDKTGPLNPVYRACPISELL